MAKPVTQKDVEEALKNVQVRIIEQPAENKHRFRYKSEGRATGTLLGENSTDDLKTYPKVKIVGYQVDIYFHKIRIITHNTVTQRI